jgi:hypothetical protein
VFVLYMSRHQDEVNMRAEIEKTVAEIEQVVSLLRRHL